MASPSAPQPRPAPSSAEGSRALWGVLVAGLVLKLAVLWTRTRDPDFAQPWLDAGFHHWIARGWAFGEWTLPPDVPDPHLDETPFSRPPLYPALLTVVYKLTGGSMVAARVAQALVGTLAAAASGLIARRLVPGATLAASLTAALVLLCGELVYFEGELVAAAPAGAAMAGLGLALLRWREVPSTGRAIAVALALIVSVHLRPNLLALLPLVVAGLWWRPSADGRPRRAVAVVLVVLGLGLALVPVAVRNAQASGAAVLMSTNGGITLLHGNHDGADGQTMSLPPHPALRAVQDLSPFGYPRLAQTVSAGLRKPLTVPETDRWFREQAVAWIKGHPGAFVRISLRKLAMLLGPVPVSNNKQVALELDANPILRLLPVRWWVLMCLAWVGLVVGLRRSRDEGGASGDSATTPKTLTVGLLLAVALVVAGVVPFLPAARFRAPLVPLLAPLAVAGVCALVVALRERARLPLTLGALIVGLVLFVPNWTGVSPDPAQWRLDRSRAERQSGDLAAAAAELELALSRSPTHPEVHVQLGYLKAIQRDLLGAKRHFEAALKARPDHLQARAQLGATLYGLGDAARAAPLLAEVVRRVPADVSSRYNYALALEQLGQRAPATAQLEQVLKAKPDLVPAQKALRRLRGQVP